MTINQIGYTSLLIKLEIMKKNVNILITNLFIKSSKSESQDTEIIRGNLWKVTSRAKWSSNPNNISGVV